MRATVTILYEDGLPVPRTRKPVMVEADVDVSTGKHPVTSRVTTTAWTSEPATGTRAIVRPLHDVVLLWIAFRGLRIRGLEIVDGGREVAQEWFIVPLPDAHGSQETGQPK